MTGRPLWTVHDVAERWACSTRTVQKKIASGELPALHLGPKLVRIRPQDVEALEAKLEGRSD